MKYRQPALGLAMWDACFSKSVLHRSWLHETEHHEHISLSSTTQGYPWNLRNGAKPWCLGPLEAWEAVCFPLRAGLPCSHLSRLLPGITPGSRQPGWASSPPDPGRHPPRQRCPDPPWSSARPIPGLDGLCYLSWETKYHPY